MKCNYTYKWLEEEYENFQAPLSPEYYIYDMLTLHSNITVLLYSGKDGNKAYFIFIFLFLEILKYSGHCYK